MAIKTQPTDADVEAFLASVPNETRRADARTVCAMMARVTGCPPVMWGPGIVGFDRHDYTYDSGHEGACFITGVAPRKTALTVYVMPGFGDYAAPLKRLGKHKTAKSCLYINKLADIDLAVLEAIVADSVAVMRRRYAD